ncbi:MAG TPA: hypothetical protein VHM24_12715 [Gemmatimonadaceae bacterium]|nr:hypothetical protein [Gemmatimonadaceae bacterium]
MTVPSSAADIILAPPPGTGESITFPLGWLLDNACGPIKYRSATEVARVSDVSVRELGFLPYAYAPALRLALSQNVDGIWNSAMMAVPRQSGDFTSVGTIPAVRRLLEYGWDRESPPLALARRALFRLLAEDNDPAYLYELGPKAKDDDSVRRGRMLLREAAAAALAQGGYESDPRLRGAARRILERVDAYLSSPLAEKPWKRVGNVHVLAPEVSPPTFHTLTMLAHMPIFRNENYTETERIYQYIAQPHPRQESIQLIGKKMVEQPQFVLGDRLPHRNAVEADIPFALMWIETMARLGFLRRNENWMKMFERFEDDRDRSGVWHPHKGTSIPATSNPRVWPMFPLEDLSGGVTSRTTGAAWADVTFRIGLIGKLLGRDVKVI